MKKISTIRFHAFRIFRGPFFFSLSNLLSLSCVFAIVIFLKNIARYFEPFSLLYLAMYVYLSVKNGAGQKSGHPLIYRREILESLFIGKQSELKAETKIAVAVARAVVVAIGSPTVRGIVVPTAATVNTMGALLRPLPL